MNFWSHVRYFDPAEFACKCGQCKLSSASYAAGSMHKDFILRLDLLRARFGSPLHVTSGLRCETHNESVGGAKSSRHLVGRAADLSSTGRTQYKLIPIAISAGMTGIGVATSFLHVDDNHENPTVWHY